MSESAEPNSAIDLARTPPGRRALRLSGGAISLTLFAAVIYYVLFRLPFKWPPQLTLWSASYAFGFNNTVAIVGLAGLLGIATLFYLVRNRREIAPLELVAKQNSAGQRSFRITFAIVALLYAILTGLFYIYYVHTDSPLLWEARHFLHRARLMELYGLRPYIDFQAEYGPLLTVTPVYVHALLKPVGINLEQAYFVTHLLLNLAGVWCIYYVLSCVRMPAGERIVAFCLLAIAGFAPYMGLNGILSRYLCPIACLLAGHRLLSKIPSQKSTFSLYLRASLAVALLLMINVLYSPEAAVAFVVAWFTYALLMVRFNRMILISSVAAIIATMLFCWLTLPAAYYGSLLRFSEGANNLPLLPAFHLVFYVLTLFLIVPLLLAAGLREEATSPSAAAICGSAGVLCAVMAVGALSRCDPPHVLFFGMVPSLLLMIRLANRSCFAFAAYTLAYAAVFIVLMQVVNLQVFFDLPLGELMSPSGLTALRRHLNSAEGTGHLSSPALSVLDRYPQLGLPYVTFGDAEAERYVVTRGHLTPEYYVAIVGVYTANALERKLSDIAKGEYLLVPQEFAAPQTQHLCQRYLPEIRRWFLYPANLPCRANPIDPVAAVSQFIVDHYAPVEHVGSSVVFRRTSAASGVTTKSQQK